MTDPDNRPQCLQCTALTGPDHAMRCTRHRAAGLQSVWIAPRLAEMRQRCDAFARAAQPRSLERVR